MELTRSLLSSKLDFQKPIYLIFYAGEEAGYVGSKAIVKEFMQLDMTGFVITVCGCFEFSRSFFSPTM